MSNFVSVKYRDLIPYLFTAELKADLNRYYLGTLWWFLEPALYVAVFYFAFTNIRGVGRGEDFVYFLMCGVATWKWIGSGVTQGANSLVSKKVLLSNFNIHPAVFPLITLLGNSFKYLVVLSLLVLLFGYKGVLNFSDLPSLVLWCLTSATAIYAYSVLLAPLVVFAPDFRLLIQNVMMLLLWVSGVILPIEKMPAEVQEVLVWNPFSHLIKGAREIFLWGETIDFSLFAQILSIHIVLIVTGFAFLSTFKGEIPKRFV